MNTLVVRLCLFAFTFHMVGCSQSEEGPKLHKVTGTVTVDGEPLSLGVITFDPADGIAGSYGGEIHEGKYQIESAIGPKNVSILASRPSKVPGPDGGPTQEQYLPAKYNMKTELTADVVAEGPNTFSFDLKTK